MARFSSLVVVVFLLCVIASSFATTVDVETICKKATNPSFCSTLLNSKPGKGEDLVSLAQYTIDVVRANLTNTVNLINKLIAQSGSNVKAREHYKTCLSQFGNNEGALSDLADAQQLLKTRDYQGVNLRVSSIITNIDDCISGETPSDPPYHDTSLLPKYANFVEQVAQIILIISNYLIH